MVASFHSASVPVSVASTSIRAQCIRASDQLSSSILLISPTFRHSSIDTQWCHHHVWVSIRTWRVFATTLGTLDSTPMSNFVALTNQLLICCFMFRWLRVSFLLRYQTIWLFGCLYLLYTMSEHTPLHSKIEWGD